MTSHDFETMSRTKIQEVFTKSVADIGKVLQEYFEDSDMETRNGIHNHLKDVRNQFEHLGFPAEQLSITFICLGRHSTLRASFYAGKHGWIHSN